MDDHRTDVFSKTHPASNVSRTHPAELDRRLSDLAARQHGVVHARQMTQLGMSRPSIVTRVRGGRLHVVFPRVYAVGHAALSDRGRWMAATLAAGKGAVLTGASAAQLRRCWRLSAVEQPHVLVAARRPAIDDITMSLTRSLPGDEMAVFDGIPIASVARMLIDLSADLDQYDLVAVIDELRHQRLFDVRSLARVNDRHRTRRGQGHRVVGAAIELYRSGSRGSRSPAERYFHRLARDNGLRIALWNEPLRLGDGTFPDPIEPDFRWPRERVIVEIDGGDHDDPKVQREDRERDARTSAVGYITIRIPPSFLYSAPDDVLAHVIDALARRAR